jgi:hypothetical protein
LHTASFRIVPTFCYFDFRKSIAELMKGFLGGVLLLHEAKDRMHAPILGRFALAAATMFAVVEFAVRSVAAAEPAKASTTAADAKPGLDLLAAEPQNSWLHERAAAAGWTLKDGKLTATAKSTPLVSTHALGDFELHVEWKVAEGGVIRLCFPKTPETKPVTQAAEIDLAEQPGISIRLPQGAKILKVDPKLRGKLHSIVIKRVGDVLVLDCDGTRSRELPIAADETFGLTIAVDGGAASGKATIESLRLVQSGETAAAKK